MAIDVRPAKRGRKITPPISDAPYDYLSPSDGQRLLDHLARRYMNMSGPECVAKYQAGELEDPDRSEVIRVAMLILFTGE